MLNEILQLEGHCFTHLNLLFNNNCNRGEASLYARVTNWFLVWLGKNQFYLTFINHEIFQYKIPITKYDLYRIEEKYESTKQQR